MQRIERPLSVEQLELLLSEPTAQVVKTLAALEGDILVLGVAGKMGTTLARMAARALEQAGQTHRKIIGVARFSNANEQDKLQSWGVKTIKADLLAGDLLAGNALAALPNAPTVIYMAGMKFGATGNESMTWAMNSFLPGLVCQRFPESRIAAFSTGNVYGLFPVHGGGARETDPLTPIGEYSISCLGRERMFEHFSKTNGTLVSILRLNYACEMRYGVLVDLARAVWTGQSVDLSMANFNIIWQADANAMSLASLGQASSPPFVINIAGPEMLSIRNVLQQFAVLMNREALFHGEEKSDAGISNGQVAHRLYGYPRVSANELIEWIAHWVMEGRESLNEPTHLRPATGNTELIFCDDEFQNPPTSRTRRRDPSPSIGVECFTQAG